MCWIYPCFSIPCILFVIGHTRTGSQHYHKRQATVHTQIHTHNQFRITNWTNIVFGLWREGWSTLTGRRRTYKLKLMQKDPSWPRTLLLWGDRADQLLIILPWWKSVKWKLDRCKNWKTLDHLYVSMYLDFFFYLQHNLQCTPEVMVVHSLGVNCDLLESV